MQLGRTVPVIGMLIVSILGVPATGAGAAENACGPMTPAEEGILKLQTDNEGLLARIRLLETARGIPAGRILTKKVLRLKQIAADVRQQRQCTAELDGFFRWMSANLAGYNRYLQAGSYAAVVARVLPIPYAGQASVFTKFLAQFTVALNNASVAVTNYQASSKRFIELSDALDPVVPPGEKALAEAAGAAEGLLKDMNDTQAKLSSISELSAGALSFLNALCGSMGNTDEYWNKARGIFKKDPDPKEKSFLSESAETLRLKAELFNARFRSFQELAAKETAAVRSLAVYDELLADAAQQQ